MSFSQQKLNSYAISLGLTNTEFDELATRMSGFLDNNPTPARIKDSFFILLDISKRSAVVAKAKHYTWGMHNVLLKKYGWKIEMLYKEGKGLQAISKELWINHRVAISKSQVDRFIKFNGITRD